VLVEGDDINDPISDYARATLDGHIILSRTLANNGIYPAIDLMSSKSRLINKLHSEEQYSIVKKVLEIYSEYNEYKDMISIGAYKKGTNPGLDKTIERYHVIKDYFKQETAVINHKTDSVFEELEGFLK
jgi:flagellum-specific ATP synthase